MLKKSASKQDLSRCVAASSKQIHKRLLRWYKANGRGLPWRKTRDPYAIWISEIMLQQTQVATVIPYYKTFLKTFPTVHHLANAKLTEVLKVWEGLGYYSRARNLHRASQIIMNHFSGKIPDNLKDLLSLPGIGRSTAGAILSIAFNKTAPILDGNVKRVLSRLFAVSWNPKENKTVESLWQLSESLVPKGKASLFNQALMDLGSMICIPKDPLCPQCPMENICKGYRLGEPERFPSQVAKKRIPHIEAVAAVIQKGGKVLLKQRPPKGLLGGLWEFPNWRIKQNGSSKVRLRNDIKKEMEMDVEVQEYKGVFRQTYSHFKLTLHLYRCEHLGGRGNGKWILIKKLDRLPMSRIHRHIATQELSWGQACNNSIS